MLPFWIVIGCLSGRELVLRQGGGGEVVHAYSLSNFSLPQYSKVTKFKMAVYNKNVHCN